METLASQIAHWAGTAGTFAILTILVKQHTIWVRLKDRLNTLWRKHCRETGQDYVPLDNGRND
jgi:hypothetical protein